MYVLTVNIRSDFVEIFSDGDYKTLVSKVLEYYSNEYTEQFISDKDFRKLTEFLLKLEVKYCEYSKLQLSKCHIQILYS